MYNNKVKVCTQSETYLLSQLIYVCSLSPLASIKCSAFPQSADHVNPIDVNDVNGGL